MGNRRRVRTGFLSLLALATMAMAQASSAGAALNRAAPPQPTLPQSQALPDPFASQAQTASQDSAPVLWKQLVPATLADQKKIWTFPARLFQGHDWKPTLAVIGTTAALMAIDAPAAKRFRNTNSFSGFNRVFTGTDMAVATAAIPATEYVAGLVRRDGYMQQTAVYTAEAVIDSEIVAAALKEATYRQRPLDIPPGGNFSDSWAESPGLLKRVDGSFPSGHTVAALAVATIIARRYRQHRWVPIAAYAFGILVGFSRLAKSDHYPSDVFAGAALGYTISRFVVLGRNGGN